MELKKKGKNELVFFLSIGFEWSRWQKSWTQLRMSKAERERVRKTGYRYIF